METQTSIFTGGSLNEDSAYRDRVIIHADFNSFFARVEQQCNPNIRNRPVGVIKSAGRGCVIAASPEAKRLGVGTGSDVVTARGKIGDITFVPANFDKYFDITKRFIEIASRYTDKLEVFSLDEVFMDVTGTEKLWGNVFQLICEMKADLRREIGEIVTVSVGIANSRRIAKLASEYAGVDGIFWIGEENKIAVLDKTPLTKILGIGHRMEKRLKVLGITDFVNLRSKSIDYLVYWFGPFWSRHLYNLARGIDNTAITTADEWARPKSVSRTFTRFTNANSTWEKRQTLRNLCDEVGEKLRKMNLKAKRIGLSVRGKETSYWGQGRVGFYGTNDGKDIFTVAEKILNGFRINEPLRFFGVFVTDIFEDVAPTVPMFIEDRRRQTILEAVDKINETYGSLTVFSGNLVGNELVSPEVNGYLGDKFYLFKTKS